MKECKPDLQWAITRKIKHRPKMRLFCIPHAGGSASFFRAWRSLIRQDCEMTAVQLPGRESRFSEPFLTSMEEVISMLLPGLVSMTDLPFCIFGHSLGADIALQLAHDLRKHNCRMPGILFLSGIQPPHFASRGKHLHMLDDSSLTIELKKFMGTPDAVMENSELMNIVLSQTRADCRVLEKYQYTGTHALPCRFMILSGEDDSMAPPSDISEWQKYTQNRCTVNAFPGGHFFHSEHTEAVVNLINAAMGEISQDGKSLTCPEIIYPGDAA